MAAIRYQCQHDLLDTCVRRWHGLPDTRLEGTVSHQETQRASLEQ